jgi:hypothetical protein
MNSKRSRLDFEDSSGPSKCIKHIVPVEILMLAGIVDGEGKEQHRLVIRPKGAPIKSFRYLLTPGAESNMQVPAGWVFDEIERRLASLEAPIPEEKVDIDVSPMED